MSSPNPSPEPERSSAEPGVEPAKPPAEGEVKKEKAPEEKKNWVIVADEDNLAKRKKEAEKEGVPADTITDDDYKFYWYIV